MKILPPLDKALVKRLNKDNVSEEFCLWLQLMRTGIPIRLTKNQKIQVYTWLLAYLYTSNESNYFDIYETYISICLNSAYSLMDCIPLSQLPEIKLFEPIYNQDGQRSRSDSWFKEYDIEQKRNIIAFCLEMVRQQ